jgi:hypothetical protein
MMECLALIDLCLVDTRYGSPTAGPGNYSNSMSVVATIVLLIVFYLIRYFNPTTAPENSYALQN